MKKLIFIFCFSVILNSLPSYNEEEVEEYCIEADLHPDTTDFEYCVEDMKREFNK
jgi:hypothetical protein